MKKIILAIRNFLFQQKRPATKKPVQVRQRVELVIIREHRNARFASGSSVQVGNAIRIKGNKCN